jgi:hypothetical protein
LVVKPAFRSNSTGKISYGTGGGLYERLGIPTITCGPGHIAQAHQPDEYVARSELDACDAFIRRLVDRQLARCYVAATARARPQADSLFSSQTPGIPALGRPERRPVCA